MNTAPTGTTTTPKAPANGVPPTSQAAPVAGTAAAPPSAPSTEAASGAVEKPAEPAEGRAAQILRQREAALVRKEQAFARDKAQADQLRAQIEAQTQALKREQEAFRAEVDRTIARVRGGQVPQRAASEEPAPWKQEIESLRTELKTERDARASREFEATKERELTQFVTEARGGKDKWPLAAKYGDTKLRAMAWRIASEDNTLDNSSILDIIEEELAEIAALKEGPKPAESSQGKSSEAGKSNGAEHQSPGTTQPAPTLTSARTGEAGDPPKKPKFNPNAALEDRLAQVRKAREELAAKRAGKA